MNISGLNCQDSKCTNIILTAKKFKVLKLSNWCFTRSTNATKSCSYKWDISKIYITKWCNWVSIIENVAKKKKDPQSSEIIWRIKHCIIDYRWLEALIKLKIERTNIIVEIELVENEDVMVLDLSSSLFDIQNIITVLSIFQFGYYFDYISQNEMFDIVSLLEPGKFVNTSNFKKIKVIALYLAQIMPDHKTPGNQCLCSQLPNHENKNGQNCIIHYKNHQVNALHKLKEWRMYNISQSKLEK